MNAPKLRFKEFNDEWSEYILNEESDVRDGTHDSPKYIDNGFPLVTSKNLNDDGTLDLENVNYLKQEDFDKINQRSKVDIGDILFGMIGTIGKPVRVSRDDFAIKNVALIKEKGIIKNDYLIHYLHSNNIIKQFASNMDGGTQKFISLDKIRKLKIKMPKRQEQEKIAKMLDLIDKKIELQTKKIEDLKLFKKGVIDYISKKIETEKIPLKNILVEQNYKTTKNNEYEILSSTAKGIYLQKDYFNKQAASDNNIGYKILKKNQLVLSPQNLWMGNININKEYNIGIVSPSYKVFNINDNIDINFFNYWIKSAKALYEYKISSEQGASIVRRNLNMDLFYEIVADIPKGKWQNEIGKIIKLLDLKVQYNESSLQKLLDLKKGLMQNMFV